MKKRCVFCHKVLDEKGRCQNKACPDYIRTQILEEAEKEAANADSATADGTCQNVKCVRYKPEPTTTTEDKKESR